MNEEKVLNEVIKEAKRIIEDTEYSAKKHFNDSDYWSNIHYWLGISMVFFTTVAGIGMLQENCTWAIVSAIIAAILGAVQTFINPQEKAYAHKSIGNQYLCIRNNTRIFKSIELEGMPIAEAKQRIMFLSNERNKLNQNSPFTREEAYLKAKKDIEDGQAQYHTDKTQEGQ
ncbi:MAG: hypothetical protein ACD_20C00357G0030 [uncultured bacterium]|nr:MAG: hypothetical protein ACD_20C00357G0030 [uncultured bacterium]HBH17895.1 hypothetical protein [Cyanobacteria bacterium UBA9579]